jgi:YggT family protein
VIYLLNALSLLLEIAFDVLATLFVLRLLAEAGRADFRNPVSQFVYRYTNPVLAPVRRVLPNWRRINLAALLLAYVAMLLKLLLGLLLAGAPHPVGGVLVLAAAELLDFALLLYVVLIFAWALASMLGGDPMHPLLRLLDAIVGPSLRPLRQRLPTLGGLDFSPVVAILILMLARILVAQPLLDLGVRMTLA